MSTRAIGAALALLAAAFLGVAVHVASLLLLPRVAPRTAFARIAPLVPTATLRSLPDAASAASPLPFRDPLLATAVCRYDLGQGPLRVLAPASGGAFVAVSFHTRSGRAFYALTDRAANDGRIDVMLVTDAQRNRAEASEDADAPVQTVRVTAPEAEGFVLFDVLPRFEDRDAAQRALQSMRCEVAR